MDQTPHGEDHFYQGKLIECLSYRDDYACSRGGPVMSGGVMTILVLKYILSGARGCLRPCPIVVDIKCYRFLRFQLWWCLPGAKNP
jgi:hypothetical protein